MSHEALNVLFQSYSINLYAAASRMLDKRHPQHQDKVQDLVILAYEEFIRKAENGMMMNLPLLIHYMKFRKPEVQIEMRGFSRTHKTDIYNKRNYYEGKLELYSIDNPFVKGERVETFAESIRDERDLEHELCFHIDLQDRLASLSLNEQTIVRMKLDGYDESEIAQIMCVHPSTVRIALVNIAPKMMEQETLQCALPL
jgi:hypothetical protein